MSELFIWLMQHPDVKVRFDCDGILDCLHIRVIRGQFIAEHLIDPLLELELSFKDDTENYVIAVLDDLYDRLEKEEKNENVRNVLE